MLGYNSTFTGQTFYDKRGNPLRVPPHYAIDLSLFSRPPALLKLIKSFVRDIGDSVAERRFDVQRTFSLGDVLMLVPVVRELERLGYDVHYQTDARYVPLLRALDIRTAALDRLDVYAVMLDWTVERDHLEPLLRDMHRCEIFARSIGLTQMPDRWNWDCSLSHFSEMKDDWATEGDYIVFQGSGAAQQRGLTADTVQWLLEAFTVEGIRVLYIGEPLPELVVDKKLVRLQFTTSTLLELFSWIGGARCVVTMDSSPLWVSHFTKTPVIAVLGPSRSAQRIGEHPLYPEGAVAIELNRELKCEPCFEVAEECGRKFDCLKGINPERLYELIRPHVMRYLTRQEEACDAGELGG